MTWQEFTRLEVGDVIKHRLASNKYEILKIHGPAGDPWIDFKSLETQEIFWYRHISPTWYDKVNKGLGILCSSKFYIPEEFRIKSYDR